MYLRLSSPDTLMCTKIYVSINTVNGKKERDISEHPDSRSSYNTADIRFSIISLGELLPLRLQLTTYTEMCLQEMWCTRMI